MFLTIRVHLLVICSIGSIPCTLPAATALALCSTRFSLWNRFWQNLQYQSPRGTLDKDAHSAQRNGPEIRQTTKSISQKTERDKEANLTQQLINC